MSAEPEKTSSESGLICPYCGDEDRDAWEMTACATEGDTECGNCGKSFSWNVYTSITYYGYPQKREAQP